MPYTITLDNDSPQALALVEFARNSDFLKATKRRETKKALVESEIDDLEEDEYDIPIKHHDKVIAMFKKPNRNMTRRREAVTAKRE